MPRQGVHFNISLEAQVINDELCTPNAPKVEADGPVFRRVTKSKAWVPAVRIKSPLMSKSMKPVIVPPPRVTSPVVVRRPNPPLIVPVYDSWTVRAMTEGLMVIEQSLSLVPSNKTTSKLVGMSIGTPVFRGCPQVIRAATVPNDGRNK